MNSIFLLEKYNKVIYRFIFGCWLLTEKFSDHCPQKMFCLAQGAAPPTPPPMRIVKRILKMSVFIE